MLEGTFNLGTGSDFDRDATTRLPAGSFTVMPPGMVHFGWVDGRTTVQLTGYGPWEIEYADPADDPRE